MVVHEVGRQRPARQSAALHISSYGRGHARAWARCRARGHGAVRALDPSVGHGALLLVGDDEPGLLDGVQGVLERTAARGVRNRCWCVPTCSTVVMPYTGEDALDMGCACSRKGVRPTL